MSDYLKLWEYIVQRNEDVLKLSFDEIEKISGTKLNHSFLNHKKELLEYGFEVKKISMKNKDIIFIRKSY
ncbi:MAG: hypothetical protein ACI4WM_04475 [Erysipelotrichaceae bacterium]